MIIEIIRYIVFLLVLSVILIMEQILAVPFVFLTLFLLLVRNQTSIMMIVSTLYVSLLVAAVFAVSWLLVFILIASATVIVRYWKSWFGRNWWGMSIAVLLMVAIFSIFIPPQPTVQFLIFSMIGYLLSLAVIRLEYHRKLNWIYR